MRTTFSGYFEKSFMHGLAQVGKRRSRKQLLKDIVSEAASSVDKSRGLQGRGDWQGAVSCLSQAAGIMDQAIDLAETLPGVNFTRTRSQTQQVSSRLHKVSAKVDLDALQARGVVRDCEEALCKVIAAVNAFADSLNDVMAEKEKVSFSEDLLIKSLNDQIQKSGGRDATTLAGWLKGKTNKAAAAPGEENDETETANEKPENVIEPEGKIEKPDGA